MASLTLAQLGSLVLTSIYGRRFGLDKDGFAVGHPGQRMPVEEVTTTSGSSLSPYGISNLAPVIAASSGAINYTQQTIPVGHSKVLALTSTTTAGVIVTMPANVALQSSGSTTGTAVSFYKQASVWLTAVTTGLWLVHTVAASTTTVTSSS